jgi:hypothetical protein
VWAQQDAPRPPSPAIELRISNIGEFGGPSWADTKPNPFTFSTLTVTAVDTAANTFAIAGHGLLTGDGPVRPASTLVLPSPLAPATDYWVIAPDADHVQFAVSYQNTGGGQGAGNPTTPIDLTDAGSGVITLAATADTVRAGQELLEVARGYRNVTLEIHCHSVDGVSMAMAQAILGRVVTRLAWYSQMTRLDAANIGFLKADRVRAIGGVRDALLFEPRAYLEIRFNIPAEESGQPLSIFSRAQTTGSISDPTGSVVTDPLDIPRT